MLPAAEDWFADEHWTYLQDNDPNTLRNRPKIGCATIYVPEFITPEQWAPRSPDLNPIENIWALVAGRVSIRQPKNVEGLKRAVRAAWYEVMTEECCETMADSMNARLLKVRRLRGAHTGY